MEPWFLFTFFHSYSLVCDAVWFDELEMIVSKLTLHNIPEEYIMFFCIMKSLEALDVNWGIILKLMERVNGYNIAEVEIQEWAVEGKKRNLQIL
jgi:hypothetical protein